MSEPLVHCLGEAMLELSAPRLGPATLSFGGDTLNTAVYLARLGVRTGYASAMGDDPYSAEVLAAWQAEGVGTGAVARLPGTLPGLYAIRTDPHGERSFCYWREASAARQIWRHETRAAWLVQVLACDRLHLSGITLAIAGEDGRRELFEALPAAKAKGLRLSFDSNYRPRLWPDVPTAKAAYEAILRFADLSLPGLEDEAPLFGEEDAPALIARHRAYGVGEVVLKAGGPRAWVAMGEEAPILIEGPSVTPVDTTAAGDSFAAGYLAARLAGRPAQAAALAAHRLASIVIQHPGAIIPKAAMP
jgi:2-dehydro-3-deoxygluconokinase